MPSLWSDIPYQFSMPTRVVQGAGRCGSFEGLDPLPFTRPLIVTGGSSARRQGYLDLVQRRFPGAAVFSGVEENPGTATCEAGAALARESGADGIVALGGGSAIDAAKAIALLARNGGACGEYFGTPSGVLDALPLLAIPTTSGTGTEVTPYAVLVDAATREKTTITHPSLFPRVALLDPELTLSMPHEVSLATGLDALSQCMEGVVSRRATPITDALALEGCRILRQWFPKVIAVPADLEARSAMQYVAMLSGIVVAHTGTTLVHGLGYRWTTECGLAHGVANGCLLKPLFEYNGGVLPGRVGMLASVLGTPSMSICEVLDRLFDVIGFDPAVKYRVPAKPDLPRWARDIAERPHRFRNQCGSPGVDDLTHFYECSWEGA